MWQNEDKASATGTGKCVGMCVRTWVCAFINRLSKQVVSVKRDEVGDFLLQNHVIFF